MGEEAAFASSIFSNFAMANLDNLKNEQKGMSDKSDIDLTSNCNFFDYLNTFNSCLTFSRTNSIKNRHTNKKVKQNHWTAKVMLQMQDKNGKLVPVQGLLDTGTSETIVLSNVVWKGSSKSHKDKPVQWKTMGGVFTTSQQRLLDMSFPELNPHKKVTWICHIDSRQDHAMLCTMLS